jgi:hypothetical protein
MKNRNLDHRNDWSTSFKDFEKWQKEYEFSEFDPCPIDGLELGINGINTAWEDKTFVNPPYELKSKESFVHAGINQSKNNIRSCFLLPVSTSTKLFHKHIKPNATNLIFIEGRLSFEGISENKNGSLVWINPGIGRKKHPASEIEGIETAKRKGMHDSMLVFFGDW